MTGQLEKTQAWIKEELDRTVRFWLQHGMDPVHGGVYTCLDRKGEIFSTDKSVWMQGRCGWTYAYLCTVYGTRPEWLEEIEKAGSRGYTTGFYSGQLADDSQEYETVRTLPEWEYAGLVKGWNALDGMALVEQRNHMQLGDEIEVLRPAGAVTRQRLALLTDVEGTPLTTAPHPQQMLLVQLDAPAGEFAMLRRRRRE